MMSYSLDVSGSSSGSPVEPEVQVDTEISILSVGVKFTYVVPNLSVVQANLRPVKIQLTGDDGSVFLSDAFIRADPCVDKISPPISVLLKSFCIVPVSTRTL